MIDFLLQVLWETWNIFKQASIFLLFGFLFAGVLAVLVPEKVLSKLLGTGKIKSVLWASAIGAPLPLCSCGVVPAALGLRRQGATPGATVAFLIATPETGADSISLTYALMDPDHHRGAPRCRGVHRHHRRTVHQSVRCPEDPRRFADRRASFRG